MANLAGVEFKVHVERGETTGLLWDGTFKAKETLSFGDQLRMDRLKRDLLGPGPYDGVDPEAMAQAIILSELQVRLVDAPAWWKGGLDLADANLLQEVYKGAMQIQKDHQEAISKKGEEAQAKLREEAKK